MNKASFLTTTLITFTGCYISDVGEIIKHDINYETSIQTWDEVHPEIGVSAQTLIDRINLLPYTPITWDTDAIDALPNSMSIALIPDSELIQVSHVIPGPQSFSGGLREHYKLSGSILCSLTTEDASFSFEEPGWFELFRYPSGHPNADEDNTVKFGCGSDNIPGFNSFTLADRPFRQLNIAEPLFIQIKDFITPVSSPDTLSFYLSVISYEPFLHEMRGRAADQHPPRLIFRAIDAASEPPDRQIGASDVLIGTLDLSATEPADTATPAP